MASCITSMWKGSVCPQVQLTVTQQSSTDTTVTLAWTLQYVTHGYTANTNGEGRSYSVVIDGSTVSSGTTNINGKSSYTIASGTKTVSKSTSSRSVSFSLSFYFDLTWSGVYGGTKKASGSISIGAKTSYAIKYNANGGSGAPSSQTKWHGTALTLSSTKPTRTGYAFQGWATSASGSVAYAAGASYTANAAVTLYAVWKANTYTVKYDANGGTGAPSSQTKTYGVSLTLSSTKPTRTNYAFKGWGTTASATTVSYAAGASYTANAAITLYAIWELSHTKPKLSKVTASRCDSSGNVSDDGTYALIKFSWSTSVAVSSIVIDWVDVSGETSGSATVEASGTSGTVSQIVGDGSFDAETSYSFTVTVTDSGGSADQSKTMSGTEFHVDFGEYAVAVGKPAEALLGSDGNPQKTLDVKWRSRFRDCVNIGDKAWYHDGKQGIFLSWEGFIHLQRTSAQGYHPYLGFYIDDATEADGIIRLNSSTKVMEFVGAESYKFWHDVELVGNLDFSTNEESIYGVDPNGLRKNVFQAQNFNGNTLVGYGNYSNASGATNIYGYDVNFGISNIASPTVYHPYRRRGDVLNVTIRTAGFVTNGGTEVYFWVPMTVPIVGAPTVTVASNFGFCLRQGNKYTHGSSSSANVMPDSYTASIAMFHGVQIKAVFSDTTNVTNNDAIGVYWSGTITFS